VANSPQAIKRARQNDKRRLHNNAMRSDMRTHIKKTLKLIASGEKDAAYAEYKTMTSSLDRLAGKNIVAPNKAARLKSRINTRLKAAFSA
jgi:small subunit ribosomal protein S20